MYEGRVPVRQCDRQASRKDGTLPRRQREILGRDDVGAGVARQRVHRQRDAVIQALHEHLQRALLPAVAHAPSHFVSTGRRSPVPMVRSVRSLTGRNATLDHMTTSNEHRAGEQPAGTLYRESLRTPFWWYLVALLVAALIAAEFHISGLQLTDWLSFGILLPLSVVFVWAFGRGNLEIRGASCVCAARTFRSTSSAGRSRLTR